MRQIQVSLAVVWYCIGALVVSILAHIVSGGYILLHSAAKDRPEIPQFPIPIRPATLTVLKTPRFGLFANNSDWESILPSGAGFIYHPTLGKHFLVSHYHQLHCLRSLRHYAQKQKALAAMDRSHVDHCLIYLRQMVLCNVDLTLEPADHKQSTPDGRVTKVVTGVGIMHECRDWEQVWNYMETNYVQYAGTYAGGTAK